MDYKEIFMEIKQELDMAANRSFAINNAKHTFGLIYDFIYEIEKIAEYYRGQLNMATIAGPKSSKGKTGKGLTWKIIMDMVELVEKNPDVVEFDFRYVRNYLVESKKYDSIKPERLYKIIGSSMIRMREIGFIKKIKYKTYGFNVEMIPEIKAMVGDRND